MAGNKEKRIRQALENHLRMNDSKEEAIKGTLEQFENVNSDKIRNLVDKVYSGKEPDMVEGAERDSRKFDYDDFQELLDKYPGERAGRLEEQFDRWKDDDRNFSDDEAAKKALASVQQADLDEQGREGAKMGATTQHQENRSYRKTERKDVGKNGGSEERSTWDAVGDFFNRRDKEAEEAKRRSWSEGGSEEDVKGRCPVCGSTSIKWSSNESKYICGNGHRIPADDLLPPEGEVPLINPSALIPAIIVSILSLIPGFVFGFEMWSMLFWLGATLIGFEWVF